MAALPPDERVILVGHSLGGLAVSQAMERFPSKISVAVFVTALMPGPNLNISTLQQEVLNYLTLLESLNFFKRNEVQMEKFLVQMKLASLLSRHIYSEQI